MVKALNKGGWDAVAVNFRGCSGEPNKKLRFYHSGDTAELETILSHIIGLGRYQELALVGFSLGANLILKYLGEQGSNVYAAIKKAAVFSAPCDLTSCSEALGTISNRLYMRRFLKMLHEKIRMKMQIMPESMDDADYDRIKNFKHFDDAYTAPMFGFENAEDYWAKASSKPFLPHISIPTLIVNAADDPFIGAPCYPNEEASRSKTVFLEVPDHGGHVGFVAFNNQKQYWSESRAVTFLNE
jgi:predicted alpha/beta-fold hydrolase